MCDACACKEFIQHPWKSDHCVNCFHDHSRMNQNANSSTSSTTNENASKQKQPEKRRTLYRANSQRNSGSISRSNSNLMRMNLQQQQQLQTVISSMNLSNQQNQNQMTNSNVQANNNQSNLQNNNNTNVRALPNPQFLNQSMKQASSGSLKDNLAVNAKNSNPNQPSSLTQSTKTLSNSSPSVPSPSKTNEKDLQKSLFSKASQSLETTKPSRSNSQGSIRTLPLPPANDAQSPHRQAPSLPKSDNVNKEKENGGGSGFGSFLGVVASTPQRPLTPQPVASIPTVSQKPLIESSNTSTNQMNDSETSSTIVSPKPSWNVKPGGGTNTVQQQQGSFLQQQKPTISESEPQKQVDPHQQIEDSNYGPVPLSSRMSPLTVPAISQVPSTTTTTKDIESNSSSSNGSLGSIDYGVIPRIDNQNPLLPLPAGTANTPKPGAFEENSPYAFMPAPSTMSPPGVGGAYGRITTTPDSNSTPSPPAAQSQYAQIPQVSGAAPIQGKDRPVSVIPPPPPPLQKSISIIPPPPPPLQKTIMSDTELMGNVPNARRVAFTNERKRSMSDVTSHQDNSFLTQSISGRPHSKTVRGSRSSRQLSPTRSYREKVALEILETERTYLWNLETLVRTFMIPLRRETRLISSKAVDEIFGNIEQIVTINRSLLERLEERIHAWDDETTKIGDIFVEIGSSFRPYYTQYWEGYLNAISVLNECEKNATFSLWIANASLAPELKFLSFRSLMALPIQHISTYNVLLLDLFENTEPTHPDKETLRIAVVLMKQIADGIEFAIKEGENKQKILTIQTSFITNGGFDFVLPGRKYIRDGLLTKVCRKANKERWFFLFNDVLVYATVAVTGAKLLMNKFVYHGSFDTSKIEIADIPDTLFTKNAFQFISTKKSFKLIAETVQEKQEWMRDLMEVRNDAMSKKHIGRKNTKAAPPTPDPTVLSGTFRGSIMSDTIPINEPNYAVLTVDPQGEGEEMFAPVWQEDRSAKGCLLCGQAFTLLRRRHHCRICGNLICHSCSKNKAKLPGRQTKERACDVCFAKTVLTSPESQQTIRRMSFASSDSPVQSPSPIQHQQHHSQLPPDRSSSPSIGNSTNTNLQTNQQQSSSPIYARLEDAKQATATIIPFSDLIFEKEIGRGGFGVVYKGTFKGRVVAIKKSREDLPDPSSFQREVDLIQKLPFHPNLVRLEGISTDPKNPKSPVIVVEYVEGGSLSDLMEQKIPLSMSDKMHVIRGTARGMYHLADHHITHRDLAARNILLARGMEPKITDFGLSREVKDIGPGGAAFGVTNSQFGPLRWMAPEAIVDRVFSERTDVWSFGIFLVEILSESPPFPDLPQMKVAMHNAHQSPVGSILKMDPLWPNMLRHVIEACLMFDPKSRPTFRQLVDILEKPIINQEE